MSRLQPLTFTVPLQIIRSRLLRAIAHELYSYAYRDRIYGPLTQVETRAVALADTVLAFVEDIVPKDEVFPSFITATTTEEVKVSSGENWLLWYIRKFLTSANAQSGLVLNHDETCIIVAAAMVRVLLEHTGPSNATAELVSLMEEIKYFCGQIGRVMVSHKPLIEGSVRLMKDRLVKDAPPEDADAESISDPASASGSVIDFSNKRKRPTSDAGEGEASAAKKIKIVSVTKLELYIMDIVYEMMNEGVSDIPEDILSAIYESMRFNPGGPTSFKI